MASLKSLAVAFTVVACAVTLSSAQLDLQKALGCPGAPWCPVWVKCNYTEAPGASCHDCDTRVICTPLGGLLRPCLVPGFKHCVNGLCRRTPNAACDTEEPTEVPTEPTPPLSTPDPSEVPSVVEPEPSSIN